MSIKNYSDAALKLGIGLSVETVNEDDLTKLYGLHVKTVYNEYAGLSVCFV